jgi:hypothetical protein
MFVPPISSCYCTTPKQLNTGHACLVTPSTFGEQNYVCRTEFTFTRTGLDGLEIFPAVGSYHLGRVFDSRVAVILSSRQVFEYVDNQ